MTATLDPAVLRKLIAVCPELNTISYNHDDVCELNQWAAKAYVAMKDALRENEALRKDAERYRWLRECAPIRSDRTIYITQNLYDNGEFQGCDYIWTDRLDATIDAAITREGKG